MMKITGTEGMPAVPVGVSAADHHGGMIFSAAILAALVRQGRTGEGARVEVDLMSAALHLQQESLVAHVNGDKERSLRAPEHIGGWHYPAPYGFYHTKDGEMVVSLCAYDVLGKALECSKLAKMTEEDRWTKREEIAALVQKALETDTTKAWCARLDEHLIWNAPVQDYNDVLEDPQVQHNGNIVQTQLATGETVTLLAHAATYDGERPGVHLAPQPLGAQTREILQELGYSAGDIEKFSETKVVAF